MKEYINPKGPPVSALAVRRAKRASAEHRALNAKHGHSQGSARYSELRRLRIPYVNLRQNKVGYFEKK